MATTVREYVGGPELTPEEWPHPLPSLDDLKGPWKPRKAGEAYRKATAAVAFVVCCAFGPLAGFTFLVSANALYRVNNVN